ncbi:hypothetical protein VJI72_08395, partial [Parvimonas micra]|nr:hypothetical protein [Parvimonas micra]
GLLLDEPTAAQDLAHQLAVLDIARSHAAAGGAVVAVLHDINLAVRAADRLLVLCGGRTAAVGPPAAILTEQLLAEVFRLRLVPGMLPPA